MSNIYPPNHVKKILNEKVKLFKLEINYEAIQIFISLNDD